MNVNGMIYWPRVVMMNSPLSTVGSGVSKMMLRSRHNIGSLTVIEGLERIIRVVNDRYTPNAIAILDLWNTS